MYAASEVLPRYNPQLDWSEVSRRSTLQRGRAEREEEALQVVTNLTLERMKGTYADFFEQGGAFAKVPGFFADHLYSPADKGSRDHALGTLSAGVTGLVGQQMAQRIRDLVQLVRVTDELDRTTARVLLSGPLLGVMHPRSGGLGPEDLHEAQVRAGQFDRRRAQVNLAHDALDFFFGLARLPLVSLVLAPLRALASVAGAHSLLGTLDAGYELARGLGDARPFLSAFRERELALIAEQEAAGSGAAMLWQ